MAHIFRFYTESLEEPTCQLIGDELKHLHTLRFQQGQELELFDGKGQIALGILENLQKQSAQIQIKEIKKHEKPQAPLILVMGMLQGKSLDDILPGLVELGLDELHIFGQANTAKYQFDLKKQARWNKISLAACKQSKRAFLPELHFHSSLEAFFSTLKEKKPLKSTRLLCSPDASLSLLEYPIKHSEPVYLGVGSEAGLSPSEINLFLEENFTPVKLSNNILRSVTAATASITFLHMAINAKIH